MIKYFDSQVLFKVRKGMDRSETFEPLIRIRILETTCDLSSLQQAAGSDLAAYPGFAAQPSLRPCASSESPGAEASTSPYRNELTIFWMLCVEICFVAVEKYTPIDTEMLRQIASSPHDNTIPTFPRLRPPTILQHSYLETTLFTFCTSFDSRRQRL